MKTPEEAWEVMGWGASLDVNENDYYGGGGGCDDDYQGVGGHGRWWGGWLTCRFAKGEGCTSCQKYRLPEVHFVDDMNNFALLGNSGDYSTVKEVFCVSHVHLFTLTSDTLPT